MPIQKKYLTVDEAQQIIPEARSIMLELVQLQQAIAYANRVQVKFSDQFEHVRYQTEYKKNVAQLTVQFHEKVETLLKMGVIVKDVQKGLVDIYSIFEGREIFLCWRVNEEAVHAWHEVNTGFAQRQPIEMLKAAE